MRHGGMTRRECFVALGATVALGAMADGGTLVTERASAAPPGMVVVPGGPFRMGTPEGLLGRLARQGGYHPSWFTGEAPDRSVEVAAFAIDTHAVTNGQYALFCAAIGHPPPLHWPNGELPDHLSDHPVVFVALADCSAYASWAGKRLPTEVEWEKAARGTDGRIYPWGDRWEPDACHWRSDPERVNGTVPVDAHAAGDSPYGCRQMAGNVAEYCADGPGAGAAYIKGGAWINEDPVNLRPAARNMSGFANNKSAFYGFRCVKEVI